MTTARYHRYQFIATPDGDGTVQWCTDTQVCVWILKKDWRGKSYPGKFSEKSPTISVTYPIDQVGRP
jgi:hypothetical protein